MEMACLVGSTRRWWRRTAHDCGGVGCCSQMLHSLPPTRPNKMSTSSTNRANPFFAEHCETPCQQELNKLAKSEIGQILVALPNNNDAAALRRVCVLETTMHMLLYCLITCMNSCVCKFAYIPDPCLCEQKKPITRCACKFRDLSSIPALQILIHSHQSGTVQHKINLQICFANDETCLGPCHIPELLLIHRVQHVKARHASGMRIVLKRWQALLDPLNHIPALGLNI